MFKYNPFTRKLDLVKKYVERLEYGVKIISNEPYMDDGDTFQRVWIDGSGKHYYFNDDGTEEIKEKTD